MAEEVTTSNEQPRANFEEVGAQESSLWLADYRVGIDTAKSTGQMLLLWFYEPGAAEANAHFAREVLSESGIQTQLATMTTVRLPLDAETVVDGKPIRVLSHPAFAEMLGRPGLAIIDQRDAQSPHFGRVVSVYPFVKLPIGREMLAVLLDLPYGSLTQRTLLFAVRTHPERPQSAWSHTSVLLTQETQQHAHHQAAIRVQGHHNWDRRFHSINARLPSGLVANEVCAESWPGQTLVEAAEECVDCWRQSSGHWDHVRQRHAFFGYDMQRGRNGVWYAAGIFASQR